MRERRSVAVACVRTRHLLERFHGIAHALRLETFLRLVLQFHATQEVVVADATVNELRRRLASQIIWILLASSYLVQQFPAFDRVGA